MNQYSITLYDRLAPNHEIRICLWAKNKHAALDRGLTCGDVIEVRRLTGTWPLDARKASAKLWES